MSQQQPTRKEEVATERRRRQPGTLDRMQQLKLAIPDSVYAKYPQSDYVFRWVNDKGSRIHDLTIKDDYNKVEGVDPRPVDTDDRGQPIYAHLCAKRRTFFDEDQREKLGAIDQRERALLTAPDPEAATKGEIQVRQGNSITPGYTP